MPPLTILTGDQFHHIFQQDKICFIWNSVLHLRLALLRGLLLWSQQIGCKSEQTVVESAIQTTIVNALVGLCRCARKAARFPIALSAITRVSHFCQLNNCNCLTITNFGDCTGSNLNKGRWSSECWFICWNGKTSLARWETKFGCFDFERGARQVKGWPKFTVSFTTIMENITAKLSSSSCFSGWIMGVLAVWLGGTRDIDPATVVTDFHKPHILCAPQPKKSPHWLDWFFSHILTSLCSVQQSTTTTTITTAREAKHIIDLQRLLTHSIRGVCLTKKQQNIKKANSCSNSCRAIWSKARQPQNLRKIGVEFKWILIFCLQPSKKTWRDLHKKKQIG